MLELKMIFRNRRPKPVLFTSFLMVFYGLLFYSDQINHDMFKVFVGSFMTGIFIFSYGILAFGWESSYFGLIMTGRIEFRSYLRAKYYFYDSSNNNFIHSYNLLYNIRNKNIPYKYSNVSF